MLSTSPQSAPPTPPAPQQVVKLLKPDGAGHMERIFAGFSEGGSGGGPFLSRDGFDSLCSALQQQQLPPPAPAPDLRAVFAVSFPRRGGRAFRPLTNTHTFAAPSRTALRARRRERALPLRAWRCGSAISLVAARSAHHMACVSHSAGCARVRPTTGCLRSRRAPELYATGRHTAVGAASGRPHLFDCGPDVFPCSVSARLRAPGAR